MPNTRKKRLSQREQDKKKAEIEQLEARTRQAREALTAAEERSTRPTLPPMTQLVMALKVLTWHNEAGGGQIPWVKYNSKLMDEGVLARGHFDYGKEVANAFGTFTSKVRVSHTRRAVLAQSLVPRSARARGGKRELLYACKPTARVGAACVGRMETGVAPARAGRRVGVVCVP